MNDHKYIHQKHILYAVFFLVLVCIPSSTSAQSLSIATCTLCRVNEYLSNSTHCQVIPAGFRLDPTGNALVICPFGTYSSGGLRASTCPRCQSGYYCKQGANNSSPLEDLTPPGFYYNAFSNTIALTPCPLGTYNNKTGGASVSDCYPCPPGYVCGSIGQSDPYVTPCAPGYYCPVGTNFLTQIPCPGGTYNPNISGTDINSCLPCTSGNYCPPGSSQSLPCTPGSYCTGGNTVPTACIAGTYSAIFGASSAANCTLCTAGNYCPSGSTATVSCPVGTFSNMTGLTDVSQCQACTAGSTCGSIGLTSPSGSCAQGYYCPVGTSLTNQYPCPGGTYTDLTNLTNAASCTICPKGFSCPQGTGGISNPPLPCAPGFYCPLGTTVSTQFPCNPGTYSPFSNLTAANECLPCPAGSYCSGGWSAIGSPTDGVGACAAGHACPQNSSVPTQNACPAGTYSPFTNLTSITECLPCTLGNFCRFPGTITPTPCNAGSFQNSTGATSCIISPEGFQATVGSVNPIPCSPGFFSRTNQGVCTPCTTGFYCPNIGTTFTAMTKLYACSSGFFCATGKASAPITPDDLCPLGYYCPSATDQPILCNPGTYANVTGLSECIACPPGLYCIAGASNPTGPCDVGHFCSVNSSGPRQNACPGGTYNPFAQKSSLTDCLSCGNGTFCPPGSFTQTPCPQGNYCPSGSSSPTPCSIGTFGNRTNLASLTECTPCSPGKFCDTRGLIAPTGLCDPGYYCTGGSPLSSPGSNPTEEAPWVALLGNYGSICPPGGYCPAGAYEPSPCPIGTYLNSTGESSPAGCLTCTPGSYCASTALPGPTGLCSPGYYCTGGATHPQQYTAPNGTYTLAGAAAPTECQPGTFQGKEGQSFCDPCPLGRYCTTLRTIAPTVCPSGYYCPLATVLPYACPKGTFSNQTGNGNVTDCESCTPGSYCSSSGLSFPTNPCTPGYYCTGGAYLPDPTGNVVPFGDLCPSGYYCPLGSHSPKPCPAGTYNPSTGRSTLTDCRICDPGKYCNTTGLALPQGLCDPGYYCTGGSIYSAPFSNFNVTGNCGDGSIVAANNVTGNGVSSSSSSIPCSLYSLTNNNTVSPFSLTLTLTLTNSSSTSMGGICLPGYACPSGSILPSPCIPGTYQNLTGQSLCLPCPPGYVCGSTATVQPVPCPLGYVCSVGTIIVNRPCLPGTYGPVTGLTNENDCFSCPGGEYCAIPGLNRTSGSCTAGYSCPPRSTNAFGGDGTLNILARPCPPGNYCPTGTAVPYPCGPGTYQPLTSATGRTYCLYCPPGQYCGSSGLTLPTGNCSAGFFCTANVTVPNPFTGITNVTLPLDEENNNTLPLRYLLVGGDICPRGAYCPSGSTLPVYCTPGTYMNVTGATESCLPCPSGYVCAGNGTADYTSVICPHGYYCPIGTSLLHQYPCPPGTYNNLTGRTALSACIVCEPGSYCAGTANTYPTGLCANGWYCTNGANTSQPGEGSVHGGPCGPGDYCPLGSASRKPCPSGMYCNGTDGLPTGACLSGHYCRGGSWTAAPLGEINPWFGTNYTIGNVCPLGHYCPSGTANPLPCRNGTYGPTIGASSSDTQCLPCPSGSFCNGTGLAYATDAYRCLPGYYCPTGTVYPSLLCPIGYACPFGSSQPVPCTPGTFTNTTGNPVCLPCPSGMHCPQPQTTVPFLCLPGYACSGSSVTGYEEPCAIGTYSNVTGLTTRNDCQPCTPGYACETEGLANPNVLCAPGFYCRGGTRSRTPVALLDLVLYDYGIVPIQSNVNIFDYNISLNDIQQAYTCTVGTTALNVSYIHAAGGDICPVGHYCPSGSTSPVPCPVGTYMNTTGSTALSSCLSCLPGYYCPSVAIVYPSLRCPSGYYCTGGNINGTEQPSPVQYYAPVGSIVPIPCPSGTYADTIALPNCKTCPSRYYCPSSTREPYDCPPGYVCGNGTRSATEVPCLPGTFSNRTNLAFLHECTPCSPGKFCGTYGLIAPTGDCDGGYVCLGRAILPNPVDTVTGYVCPAGAYCPDGSTVPTLCPPSTFNTGTGRSTLTDCLPCTPGFICPLAGTVQPSVPCAGRYYCPGGDAASTFVCPPGAYCPGGDTSPIACPPGTYTNTTGQLVCTPCPSRYHCPTGTVTPIDCPSGYFCTPGSSTGNENPCPIGTYSSVTGLGSMEECLPCTSGHYCPQTGLTLPGPLCGPGHYCLTGASVPQPIDNVTGFRCDPGYVCTYGAISSRTGDNVTGYACPSGTYCPSASIVPLACPPGTYNPTVAQGTCTVCPIGYACGGGKPYPEACPPHRYCPLGSSTGILCPPGSYKYGFTTNITVGSECTVCPIGAYCTGGNITGPCTAGHYCRSGQASPTPLTDFGHPPDMTIQGGLCWIGHYCPSGTVYPTPCPNGTVRAYTGGSNVQDCGPCPPGYICTPGDPVPLPCPRGFYCPLGTPEPLACPVGTYNPRWARNSSQDCLACLAGFECRENGIGIVTNYPCPVGRYCPTGTSFANTTLCAPGTYRDTTGAARSSDCFSCTPGYMCPFAGTIVPIACLPTTYCALGATNMTQCPGGYHCPPATGTPVPCNVTTYCPPGSGSPLLCPPYHYCPPVATVPLRCPTGYRSLDDTVWSSTNKTRGYFTDSCAVCLPGEYNDVPGNTYCRSCSPGYVCLGGTTTPVPTDVTLDKGYICPPGFYCPTGSSLPIACPSGSYNALAGRGNLTDCLLCPANYFQPLPGQTGCNVCAGSSFSLPGAVSCTCRGLNRAYQESDGSCVCKSAYEYYDASFNRLSESDGPEDCQPIVYDVCQSGYARDPSGKCKRIDDSTSVNLCGTQCPAVVPVPVTVNGQTTTTYIGKGIFNPRLGVCECEGLTPLPIVCNTDCRERSPRIEIDAGTGQLIILTEDPLTRTFLRTMIDPIHNLPSFAGDLTCLPGLKLGMDPAEGASLQTQTSIAGIALKNTCNLVTVASVPGGAGSSSSSSSSSTVGGGGFEGKFGLPVDVFTALVVANLTANGTTGGGRRRLVDDSSTVVSTDAFVHPPFLSSPPPLSSFPSSSPLLHLPSSFARSLTVSAAAYNLDPSIAPAIPLPVVCLPLGDGLLFDLRTSSDPNQHYPVYLRDSLLNTNPNFDYGSFRRLAELARGRANITLFGFTFTEPGLYDFVDAGDTNKRVVVAVMSAGSDCPTEGNSPIVPLTPSVLLRLGARRSDDILVGINWRLLGGVLGALVGLVGLTLGGAFYFQYRSWTGPRAKVSAYKLEGKALALDSLHDKGELTATVNITDTGEKPSTTVKTPGTASTALTTTTARRPSALTNGGDPSTGMIDPNAIGNAGGFAKILAAATAGPGGAGFATVVGPSTAVNTSTNHAIVPTTGTIPGLDMDRWDNDDLHLREILERLATYSTTVTNSFTASNTATSALVAAVHAEADAIKRLLARAETNHSIVNNSMDILNTDYDRRRAIVRSITDELNARTAYDRRLTAYEEKVSEAVDRLTKVMEPGADTLTDKIIQEIQTSAEFEENDGTENDGNHRKSSSSATTKTVDTTTSDIAGKIYGCLSTLQEALDQLGTAVQDERQRRQSSTPLWRSSAELGVLGDNGKNNNNPDSVQRCLEYLADTESGTENQARRLLELLAPLGLATPSIQERLLDAIHYFEELFIEAYQSMAMNDENDNGNLSLGNSSPASSSLSRNKKRTVPNEDIDNELDLLTNGNPYGTVPTASATIEIANISRAAHTRFRTLFNTLLRLLGPVPSAITRLRENIVRSRTDCNVSRDKLLHQIKSFMDDSVSNLALAVTSKRGIAVNSNLLANEQLTSLITTLQQSLETMGVPSSSSSFPTTTTESIPKTTGQRGKKKRMRQPATHNASEISTNFNLTTEFLQGSTKQSTGATVTETLQTIVTPASLVSKIEADTKKQTEQLAQKLEEENRLRTEALEREREAKKVAAMLQARAVTTVASSTVPTEATVVAVITADIDNEASIVAQALKEEALRQAQELAIRNEALQKEELNRRLRMAAIAAGEGAESTLREGQASLKARQAAERAQLEATLEAQARAQLAALTSAFVSGETVTVQIDENETFTIDPIAMSSSKDDNDENENRLREEIEQIAKECTDDVKLRWSRLRSVYEKTTQALQDTVQADQQHTVDETIQLMHTYRNEGWEKIREKHAEIIRTWVASLPSSSASLTVKEQIRSFVESFSKDIDTQLPVMTQYFTSLIDKANNLLRNHETTLQTKYRTTYDSYIAEVNAVVERTANERQRRLDDFRTKYTNNNNNPSGIRPAFVVSLVSSTIDVIYQALIAMNKGEIETGKTLLENEQQAITYNLSLTAEYRKQQWDILQRMLPRSGTKETNLRIRLQNLLYEKYPILFDDTDVKNKPVFVQIVNDTLLTEGKLLEKETMEDIRNALDTVRQTNQLARSALDEKLQEANRTIEAKLAAIHLAHETESSMLLTAISSEKRRQQAKLEAKLKERKAAQLRKLQLNQAAEITQLTNENKTNTTIRTTQAVEAIVTSTTAAEAAVRRASIAAKIDTKLLDEQVNHTVMETDKRKQELEKRLAEEKKKAEETAAEEAIKEAAQRAKEAEEKRRTAIETKKKEMEAKLAATASMTADEAARVRKEYEAELEAYTASLDAEKARQTARLNAQLEARKARKARDLARKQEAERAEEEARATAARVEAEAVAARAKEEAILRIVVNEVNSNGTTTVTDGKSTITKPMNMSTGIGQFRTEDAIDIVLRTRHTKETGDLLARQYTERSTALQRALEAIFDNQRDEKVTVATGLAASGATEHEIEVAMGSLDKKFAETRETITKNALEELEVRHAREQVNLRQRQLNEVANAFASLAPDAVLLRKEAEDAKAAADELAAFQTRLEHTRAERVANLKAQRAEVEERTRRENEEAILKLEAEHAKTLAEESARAAAALANRKAKLAADTEKARAERLKETGEMDKATRDRIMAEFEAETKALETKLEDVRNVQLANMEAKLAIRKNKKLAQVQKAAAEKLATQEREASQRISMENESANARVTAAKAMVVATTVVEPSRTSSSSSVGPLLPNDGTVTTRMVSSSSSISSSNAVPTGTVAGTVVSAPFTQLSDHLETLLPVPSPYTRIEPSDEDGSKSALAVRIVRLETILTKLVDTLNTLPSVPNENSTVTVTGSGKSSIPTNTQLPAPVITELPELTAGSTVPSFLSPLSQCIRNGTTYPSTVQDTRLTVCLPSALKESVSASLLSINPNIQISSYTLNPRQALRLDYSKRLVRVFLNNTGNSNTSSSSIPDIYAAVTFPATIAHPGLCFRNIVIYEPSSLPGSSANSSRPVLYIRTEAFESSGDLSLLIAHVCACLSSVPLISIPNRSTNILSEDIISHAITLTQLTKNMALLASWKSSSSSVSSSFSSFVSTETVGQPSPVVSPSGTNDNHRRSGFFKLGTSTRRILTGLTDDSSVVSSNNLSIITKNGNNNSNTGSLSPRSSSITPSSSSSRIPPSLQKLPSLRVTINSTNGNINNNTLPISPIAGGTTTSNDATYFQSSSLRDRMNKYAGAIKPNGK